MGILFSGKKERNGARGRLENYASSASVEKYIPVSYTHLDMPVRLDGLWHCLSLYCHWYSLEPWEMMTIVLSKKPREMVLL